MNGINKKQNAKDSIERLIAQRRLYSGAKNISYVSFLIVILMAIIFPIISDKYPEYRNIFALTAIIYLVIEIFILERIEAFKKHTAAKIQELFDTNVLELEWNSVIVGNKPDAEIVGKYQDKSSKKRIEQLKNWYSESVSKLPINVARAICQRSNVWWDSALRRRFASLIMFLLAVLLLVFLYVNKDSSLSEISISFILFLPLVRIMVKKILSHFKTAKTLDNLKEVLDKQIESFMDNPHKQESGIMARSIQDEIFKHRSTADGVPNLFYDLLKKHYEKLRVFKINKCVEEITQKQ